MYATDSDVFMGAISNYPLKILTNDTPAITIDTSQNATFAGNVLLSGYLSVTSNNIGTGATRWIGSDGTTSTWFYNVPTGGNHYFAVNNSNQLSINSTSATFAGTLDVVSNIGTQNTLIYTNDNGTKWQFGSKALMGNNRFGARYYDGSNWLSTAFSVQSNGNFAITGALSKGSGSFKIDHPIEAKKDTHHLVHSFVEAPQADNIYRGKVDLVDGKAEINIDTVSSMTEGTFVLLNTNVQCFTTNESNWDLVKGNVVGNKLTIESKNASSTASISWMVVGERQDQHMYDTQWTDENGRVITEPLKKVESTPEEEEEEITIIENN